MEIFEWRGVRDLVYAEVTGDDNEASGGYSTGDVKPLAGVAEIGKTTDTSSEAHYYDNIPAIVVASEGADEVTLTVSGLSLETQADILGKKYDASTGAMIDNVATPKYFAIGYKTKKTNGKEVYVWRLKGRFAVPDETYATEDDGTDANNVELTFTGVMTTHQFTNGGTAKAVIVDTELDKADVSAFFTNVTTPDTLQAKS